MALKFLADHNIPESIVSQLDSTGIDIVSVKSLNMTEAKDEKIMEKAIEEERVILTIDKDFISGLEKDFNHRGIIKFRERYSIGRMIRDVQKVNSSISKEEMKNSVVYLPWE
ncbi:MAG: DUF5615 family PIN-like protein [Candidatus Nanohaloarchaea archaeon]